LVHSTHFSSEHHVLLSLLSQYQEPKTYEQATKDPAWVEVMNKEIDALMSNDT